MSRIVLGLFVVVLGVDIGAGLYESRVVVPLWSRGIPTTLAAGNPFGQVAINAGMGFWAFVTPVAGLLALGALAVAWRSPQPVRTWIVAASLLELAAFASTMFYFRPTLKGLFLGHGAGMSEAAVAVVVHRWVGWNRARVALSAVAWGAAVVALALV